MIIASQLLCVVRLVLYSLASPSMSTIHWQSYFILLQLIHGFNFALFWAAAVDAFVKLSPTGSLEDYSITCAYKYQYYIACLHFLMLFMSTDLTNSCVATLNLIYTEK